MMTTLYISYDGMTDPLGQSQVLPYLKGLSEKGIHIVLLSFEKQERFETTKPLIEALCREAGIVWVPMMYTKKPPVLSTLWDVFKMKRTLLKLHRQYHFTLVHCRSHIPAIGGDYLKRRAGVPYLFDMRGFYADERVDGGLWKMSNPLLKMVYHYFKAKEKEFLKNAAATISLTEAGKKIIHRWEGFEHIPIEVIPCCADLDHFNRERVEAAQVEAWREKLGIGSDDFVVTYLGSLGTWYLGDEMFRFFKQLRIHRPEAKFLLITPDSKSMIEAIAANNHIPSTSIIVQQAKRSEVPALLMLGDISLFFIKPVFSKQASSPVKMGEILAMGIPIIANAGVGDVDSIINDTRCGILVENFSEEAFDKGIASIPEFLHADKSVFELAARKYYSLENGVDHYYKIYLEIQGKL
jgi:glycosyltransferase involved in cell wall biosynthesis